MRTRWEAVGGVDPRRGAAAHGARGVRTEGAGAGRGLGAHPVLAGRRARRHHGVVAPRPELHVHQGHRDHRVGRHARLPQRAQSAPPTASAASGILVHTPVDVGAQRRDRPALPGRGLHEQPQGHPRRLPRPARRRHEFEHPTSDIVIEDSQLRASRRRRALRRRLRQRRHDPAQPDHRAPARAASTWRPARSRTASRATPSSTTGSGRTAPAARRSRSSAEPVVLGRRPRGDLRRRQLREHDPRQRAHRELGRRHLPLQELRRVPRPGATSSAATRPTDNLIERNMFLGGRNGVWVGSRMGENTLPMECTDPAYVDEPAAPGGARPGRRQHGAGQRVPRRHLRRAGRGRRHDGRGQHLQRRRRRTATP